MRRAAKRDANEPKIINYLRRIGATVEQVNDQGKPDLLVGWMGYNFLLEVKSDTGKLTDPQIKFFDGWLGQVDIVRSIKDAKEVLRRVMPVYVYNCDTCGHFEVRQRFEDDPLVVCPTCSLTLKECPDCKECFDKSCEKCPACDTALVAHSPKVKRLIQKVAVIYATDGFVGKVKQDASS